MKSRIISRAVSLVILGILLSWAMHHYQTSRGEMGREKYLAKQAENFDKRYAKPYPFVFDLIGCVLLVVPLACAYEGLAWVVSKALKGIDEESRG
jgi:hypothetical protein